MEFPTRTNDTVCKPEVVCLSVVHFRDGSKYDHSIINIIYIVLFVYHNKIADQKHRLFSSI